MPFYRFFYFSFSSFFETHPRLILDSSGDLQLEVPVEVQLFEMISVKLSFFARIFVSISVSSLNSDAREHLQPLFMF